MILGHFKVKNAKIVKIELKICNKLQKIAKILSNFIPGQKMAHFFGKKSIFKGGSKRTPPGTQASKNLPGPIGLNNNYKCVKTRKMKI